MSLARIKGNSLYKFYLLNDRTLRNIIGIFYIFQFIALHCIALRESSHTVLGPTVPDSLYSVSAVSSGNRPFK